MAWKQLISSFRHSLLWTAPVLGILAACFGYVSYLRDKDGGADISVFFNDANAINDQPFFFGSMEHLTSSLMMMAGAILIFCAATEKKADPGTRRFVLLLGALTGFLGFDDLFMFHETIHLLIPWLGEPQVYAMYGIVLLVLGTVYFGRLLQTPFFLLGGALGCLMFSGMEDIFEWRPFGLPMEEYFELTAFIAWSMYALATAVMIRDRRIGLWSYASGSVSATELRRSFQLTARQTTTRQYYSPSKALPRA